MTHDLIVFGEDWGGLPSSTQHLINQLAKQRKIVWVNSIGLRQPTFSLKDIKRALIKIFGNKLNRIKQTHTASNSTTEKQSEDLPCENFHIVYPRTLPAPRSKLARWIASRLLVSQIIPVVQQANLQSPILWTSLPTAVDVVGKLGESVLIYYCGDDFSALAGVDHETVAKRENEISEKADLILCASEKLTQKFPSTNTRLLPHGVDFSLFSEPTPRAKDLPDNDRPIAGFYGSISEWLDIDMLSETIKKMPDWEFVFIGKAVVDTSELTKFSNVKMLGERPHHQLPTYSQHWTASLLPFVSNAQIRSCNPLKLSEYLATGRPIISSSFPAMQAFRGLVQIADNSEAMMEALRASIHIDSLPTFSGALKNTMKNNSWDARAKQVKQWIEAL